MAWTPPKETVVRHARAALADLQTPDFYRGKSVGDLAGVIGGLISHMNALLVYADHEGSQPIGYPQLSASFDHIGDALDAFKDDEITLEEFIDRISEQVGEREDNR